MGDTRAIVSYLLSRAFVEAETTGRAAA